MELESTIERSVTERSRLDPVPPNAGLVGMMRLALALSAMLIIVIEPPRPARLAALTYTVLGLYALYSGLLYLTLRLGRPLIFWRWAYWVDVGWYLLLISLTGGAESIFFVFLLFSILVASFTDGFRMGCLVSLVSALLYTAVGFATLPAPAELERDRFLMRLLIMLLLGYMFAHWGESEIKQKARLALLRDINDFSNPRFGVDRTLGYTMNKIRDALKADRCLLVTADREAGEFQLRNCSAQTAEGAVIAEPVPEGFASQLLYPPEGAIVVYPEGWRLDRVWHRAAGGSANVGRAKRELADALAALFEAKSFLSVPVRLFAGGDARFYLISNRSNAFDDSDAAFVMQALNYVLPIIENVRLIDQLATTAAEHERQKIARDIHDSFVQPYVGLRIGLIGVRQKLEGGDDATAELNRLIEMSEAAITYLRSYMGGLRGQKDQSYNLLSAIRRFTAKVAAATKLDLQIKAVGEFSVNDRLGAEIFQMVTEALSNVRRHTMATKATVTLAVNNNHFCLDVENDGWEGASTEEFTPRSITERVKALGGQLITRRLPDGGAHLHIEIPL